MMTASVEFIFYRIRIEIWNVWGGYNMGNILSFLMLTDVFLLQNEDKNLIVIRKIGTLPINNTTIFNKKKEFILMRGKMLCLLSIYFHKPISFNVINDFYFALFYNFQGKASLGYLFQ